MVDLLRVEANERVDLIDFQFALNDAMAGALREAGANFLTNPNGAVTTWILGGFGMTNPTGKQLTVTKGRALLGRQVSGLTRYGMLTVDGDATKTVDMTALTPNTYNVYVRFEYIDTNSTSRVFWDPAGTGKEFTQTIPTRLQANWSMRVETSSPGSEWTLIGTANNSGGSLVLVDMRKLYFEGAVDAAYASGWSSDGGGGANDRNADRQLYGVTDLQSFTAATRQCLEDIKGRGLRRWYSRDIGGMNIGFDAAPVEDRLAIGDAAFYFDYNSGNPQLVFDTSGNPDYLGFTRSGSRFFFQINGAERMRIHQSGQSFAGGINVGLLADSANDDAVTIMDGNFVIAGGFTFPKIIFDHYGGNQDELRFDRGNSVFNFQIAGTTYATIDATKMLHTVLIQSQGNVLAASEIISGGNVFRFGNGSNDYIGFNDSTNDLSFVIDASEEWTFDDAALDCHGNSVTGVGILSASYVRANSATALNAGDGLFTRGVNVGFDAVPTDNAVAVGDANFRMDFNTANQPALYFDSATYLDYNRSLPGSVGWRFVVGGSPVAWIRNDTSYGSVVVCPTFVPTSNTHNPPATGNSVMLNVNTCPFQTAAVDYDGTLMGDAYWNVASVTHTLGTGVYNVNYTNIRSSSNFTIGVGAPRYASYQIGVNPQYTDRTVVVTANSSGTASDCGFGVVTYTINQ